MNLPNSAVTVAGKVGTRSMSLADFIIGLTLMNAMPHFVLGTFQARMLSGFGYGNRANIVYGLFNFTISIVLYIYTYSLSGLLSRGFYLGALAVLLIYFATGKFWFSLCRERIGVPPAADDVEPAGGQRRYFTSISCDTVLQGEIARQKCKNSRHRPV